MKRPRSTQRYSYALLILSSCLLMLLIPSAHDIPLAETVTTSITGNGLGTQVLPPNNHVYGITGGQPVDTNLFHSFAQFNIAPGDTAQFQTPTLTPNAAMHNILGRITDTNPSKIFGTIDSATYYPNANLFLMNPYGFLFGPNAMVNVGGMVAFTSADYLRLADNVRFNAVPNAAADALLSTAPVVAYGFLRSNSGAITVQGSQFSVTDGQSIALVGGTITIESGTPDGGTAQPARLSAPKGNILLASAASPGEFAAATLQPLPNVDGASFTAYGAITLAPSSSIDVSGTNTVSIRGGQFVLTVNDAVLTTTTSSGAQDTIMLSRGSTFVTTAAGDEAGADVQVVATGVQLDGASITSLSTGMGPGGAISVTAEDRVSLTGGAQIVSRTEGNGIGGNITVEATSETGSVIISRYDPDRTLTGIMNPFAFDPNTGSSLVSSGIYSLTSGTQAATGGTITISAPTVSLDNVALIWTAASGDGAGGNITITNAESVTISGGAVLKSDAGQDYTTFERKGSGQGGDIFVSASDTLLVSGGNIDFGAFSTISSQTSNEAPSSGRAGDITISAPNVTLENAGTISSLSDGTGRAGNIDVTASSQLVVSGFNPDYLVDSGLLTSVLFPQDSQSNGGGIHVATPSLTLENRGLIQTLVRGTGLKGGEIFLDVTNIALQNGGLIVSSAGSGATSSHIQITASDSATISGRYVDPNDPSLNQWSAIQNRTSSDQSENGGIDIHAGMLILRDGPQYAPPNDIGEQILSRTDADAGGTIKIIADKSISMSSGANIVNEKGSLELGSISLEAPSITLSQAAIRGRTNIDRDAAGISLHATNGDLLLSNDSHVLTSTQQGGGTGGFTLLQASGSINMSGGSTVESSSFSPATGDGGAVALTAGNQVSLSGTDTALKTTTSGLGHGGSILVKGQSVTLNDHASISANTTGTATNAGDAGNILVKANDFSMSGGATITAASTGSGNAGTITIEGTASPAQSLMIDGAGSGVFTDTQGIGAGGNIFVNANSVTLQNGGTLSAKTSGTEATAIGGTIIVTATNQVTMTGGSSITASSTGPGNAGNILINAGQRLEMRDSSIKTKADQAGGGNIEINARDEIRLVDSQIDASAFLDGGNITIDPLVMALQNSQIIAQAVQGAGGNITITTPLFLADQTSLVSASSQFGLNGTVTIQSPTSNLSGSIGSLPSSISQQQALQAQRCAALSGGASSSFIIAGRDTIPTEPGGWLTRPLGLHSLGGGLRGETTIDEQQPTTLVMAQSSEAISLRRLTPAGFLIERFAGNGSDGCRS